jgi:hypothetical protein
MGSLLGDSDDVHHANESFPDRLLATVIALGFVDVNLAALLGAWLYKQAWS